MIGLNNTPTSRSKGRRRFHSGLLTPSVVGQYAMSLGTSSGYYSLQALVLASVPGHNFSSLTSGDVIGKAYAYIYNITNRKVQKKAMDLIYFGAVGDSVFFQVGKTLPVNVNRWDNIGLTMPENGDSMALSVMIQLDGARPVGGWKQTWTATL